ncbi:MULTISPECIES: hypothetical protein [unclassified Bacillus (in: firmicutes)]|uniref:hypothetical protein n=1 Tax=unclassified Bacillus (in: firmicutes) TaxID=185979 RepID=UPI001123C5A1|nr:MULTISPECIES: hypothetical protein [unclassified Bacillus (in: firmicutes)]
MHTDYINYLQSMNNANSSNDNAIAESQFINPFYEKIRVESNIGNFLIDKIKEKPTFIFLTGHAGDGKTSLLYQILRQFNAISAGVPLKEEDYVDNTYNNKKIYYVKDMSELVSNKQVGCIKQGVITVSEEGSCIIVSNTGTLIDALKKYFYGSKFSASEIEMDILKLMDENSFVEGNVGDISVLVVNLALIDNTEIVSKLIDNLLEEELWQGSDTCELKEACPIHNNYKTLKQHQEHFKQFAMNYYRWLADNDKRLTIRQILSHLSYSITGNIQCQNINVINQQRILFDYHISNLFFGYVGIDVNNDAQKIKSISEIQSLNLDEKKLIFDQELFVKEDFSNLIDEVQPIAKDIWNYYTKRQIYDTTHLLYGETPVKIRKAMRRMQMLFADITDEQKEILYGDLYSPIFVRYLDYRTNGMRVRAKRQLKEIIFKALQILIMGDNGDISSSSILYLPLKRSGLNNQNVYLLVGKIDYESLSIETIEKESVVSTNPVYQIVVKFDRLSKEYILSLPLLEYFYQIANGSLSTKLNPVLSQGIYKLKAQLYREYKFTDDEEVIKLLIQTLRGPKIIDIELDIENKKLYFN